MSCDSKLKYCSQLSSTKNTKESAPYENYANNKNPKVVDLISTTPRVKQLHNASTHFLWQLHIHRANVVSMSYVFCLSIESLLAGLDIAMVARFATAQVKLFRFLWQLTEII